MNIQNITRAKDIISRLELAKAELDILTRRGNVDYIVATGQGRIGEDHCVVSYQDLESLRTNRRNLISNLEAELTLL